MRTYSGEKRALLAETAAGNGPVYLNAFLRELAGLPVRIRKLPCPYRNGLFRLDAPGAGTVPEGLDGILAEWGMRRQRMFLLPEDSLLAAFLSAWPEPAEGETGGGERLPVLDPVSGRSRICPDVLTAPERALLCLLLAGDMDRAEYLWREQYREIRRSYAGRLRRKEGCAPYRAFALALRRDGISLADGYPLS